MSQPPLQSGEFYRDLSQDVGASQAADQVPELRLGFEKLGFRHLGFFGEYAHPGGKLWVQEVLASPRHDAFLTLSLSPPGFLNNNNRTVPTATLHSVLQDG